MPYDLKPNREEAGVHTIGAFSFTHVLGACNHLFPIINERGRWYRVLGVDDRFVNPNYPEIMMVEGFPVTDEEARIMARLVRNWVAIQRSLPEEHRGGGLLNQSAEPINRERMMAALKQALSGQTEEPWPIKVRDDFTDKAEAFAAWAATSGGFRIYGRGEALPPPGYQGEDPFAEETAALLDQVKEQL
jgi:hypothetical protein